MNQIIFKSLVIGLQPFPDFATFQCNKYALETFLLKALVTIIVSCAQTLIYFSLRRRKLIAKVAAQKDCTLSCKYTVP